MECISVFLTSSFTKEWERLDLNSYHIQDKGLYILYRRLCHSSNVTINTLWVSNNGLTTQSASLVSEIAMNCKIKILWISDNHTIGEDEQLYSMLINPSNMLEQMDMDNTQLSSGGAIKTL